MDFSTMSGFMNMMGGQKFSDTDMKQAEHMWKMMDDMAENNPQVPFPSLLYPNSQRSTKSS